MKKIYMGGKKGIGLFALVDDEDYERINSYPWHLMKDGYAGRSFNKRKIEMSKDVLRYRGMIDHINGDVRDNRKENLRPCTVTENNRNAKKKRGNTSSIYKGVRLCVSKFTGIRKWRADIRIGWEKRYIGSFDSERDAALEYNRYAKSYFGRFAKLNDV